MFITETKQIKNAFCQKKNLKCNYNKKLLIKFVNSIKIIINLIKCLEEKEKQIQQ